MKRWNWLQGAAGIVLAFWLLAACGGSGPIENTASPTPTEVISTPTPTEAPPTLTPTPTPIPPTPTPVPTPTLPPGGTPVAGPWQANGNQLGPFEFTVSADSTAITEIHFHLNNFMCGGATLTANATISDSWAIKNGNFTLDAVPNPILDVIIRGTFDQSGRYVAGSWQSVVLGQKCPGTWAGHSSS